MYNNTNNTNTNTNNPYLAHLTLNSNSNNNYNNSTSHRIHLNVNRRTKEKLNSTSKSLNAKSAFSLNKSFKPYPNDSRNSFASDKKYLKENKYIYGNYEHYYGYRNKSAIPIDPRIELFEEEWFKNKKCLDVGCNSGFLTISIAMLFEPKIIEGVDIDPHLIKKAQNYLIFRNSLIKKSEEKENEEQKKEIVEKEESSLIFDYYPISCPLTIGSIPILLNNQQNINNNNNSKTTEKIQCTNEMDIDKNINENYKNNEIIDNNKKIEKSNSCVIQNSEEDNKDKFPNNVYFRASDWINEPIIDEQRNSYDIILGLSITKWIHLNWADYGIKRFFNKVYDVLKEDGIFILEPQSFSGYNRKAKNNKKMLTNINNIQLYPEHFHDYLMNTVGFKSYELLGKSSNKSKGFQRNIYIYRK